MLAFTDSVAIGSIGQPSRWSEARPEAIRSIQPATMSVTGNPLSRKSAQPPLDVGADAVDHRGRQFLLAVGEVVIQRAGLDVGGLQDLVHPGRGVALPAEQQGCSVDEGGSASVRTRHGLDFTRKVIQEYLNSR